jgi:DNA-binding PadR family transcriptional regulator
MSDLLVLATLLRGPTHGYALKKQIGTITGQGDLHNNLVYPLLKRFVAEGWVTRRTVGGERGQTRELYALSAKGRRELVERLSVFSEKDAAHGEACLMRVGLFAILDREVRLKIIDTRDTWLAERQQRLQHLSSGMDLGEWGGESVTLLLRQVALERKWLSSLRKKAARRAKRKSD